MGYLESLYSIHRSQPVVAVAEYVKYGASYIMPHFGKKEQVAAMSTKSFRYMYSSSSIVRLAGLCGASAVVLGAIGAHRNHEATPEQKRVFDTANGYHFIHSVALLGVPMCRWPRTSGALLTLGMVLFCGSCYHHAFTGEKTFSQLTPWGGTLLIAGWLAMVL